MKGGAAVPARRWILPAGMSARRLLADRGGLVVAVCFYLLVSLVLSALWRAAAASGDVAGYSARDFTWYIFTSEAAICALSIRLIDEIGEDIASGAVTVEMLRPPAVVGVRLAVEFGRGAARLAVLLVAGTAAAWATVGPPPGIAGAVLAVPALVLALAANLALQHAVAAVAFWLRDTRAVWFLYQKLVFILGGMLLPLEVLPHPLHVVSAALPFMAMAYVPARLAAGHADAALLAVQAGWIAVLVTGAAAVFAAGQRRIEVTGG